MIESDRNDLAERWARAVREGGHDGAAELLERWLVAEDAGIGLSEHAHVLDAETLLHRAGAAFARLGSGARVAGMDLAALRAAVAPLAELVGADERGRAGVAALQGLAVGAWHAPGESGEAAGAAPSAAGAPDPFRGLDPRLGKMIRHDIKTPLQAASLNLELLAMEHEDDPNVTGAIATIMQSLDSAVEMLQRFDDV